MTTRLTLALTVLVVLAAAAAAPARAGEQIHAIDPTTAPVRVVTFDSDAPQTYTSSVPVTGLGQNVIAGIDVRPSDGRLYAVTGDGAVARLWTIDPVSGAAALIAPLTADPADSTSPYATIHGTAIGVDFDPASDRLRIVSEEDENLEVNPSNGLTITHAPVKPDSAYLVAAAYDRNDDDPTTASTLFVYDYSYDDVGVVPQPDGGTVFRRGSSTLDTDKITRATFDISRLGNAYASHSLYPTKDSRFYTVDPVTGLHMLKGILPAPLAGMSAAVPNRFAVGAATSTVAEGTGAANVRITRASPAPGSVSVSYSTSAGTASAGDDFTPSSGSVEFTAGEVAKTIAVPLRPDTDDEPDETFSVNLSVASYAPALVVAPASATVTIADDDLPPSGGAPDPPLGPVPPGAGPGPGGPSGGAPDPTPPARCANAKQGTRSGERLTGTDAGDRLIGAGGRDSLFGGAGDDCLDGGTGHDRLSAGAGADELRGGAGNDRLDGGTGDDTLFGDAGNDRLNGGAGNDQIATGAGRNVVRAGAGDDTINAKNGRRETVDCGSGRDTVTADRSDRLKGCERRRR